ncbi:hypothetical protein B0H19DRAFT_1259307 [Mycena capillaripes]|nr:hypothetical protein B0H19DRAFT_1259307 [Mycena capillaripes]
MDGNTLIDPHEHNPVQYQQNSTELVVYSRLDEMAVSCSWPTHNGTKIKPTGFKAYLRNRGLFIECFCAFTSDRLHPFSCQLVVSKVTGHVLAFCHFSSARCGFKMNLTRIYRKCLLVSSYPGLPTLASGQLPETETLLVAFRLQEFPVEEMAPHFPGYLGEHRNGYPRGTEKMCSSLLAHPPSTQSSNRRRQGSPFVRQQLQAPRSKARYYEIGDPQVPGRQVFTAPARTQNAIVSSSRVTLESASHRRPAPYPLRLGSPFRRQGEEAEGKETKFLQQLVSGGGVAEDAWDGLIEKCTKCRRLFIASALKGHVKVCLGQIVIE